MYHIIDFISYFCSKKIHNSSMTTAKEIIEYMKSLRNEEQRKNLMRFFKTAPGEYGYGDVFLGLKVPETREVVKAAKDIPIDEVPALLMSKWHEVRLCGLLILVDMFEKLATKRLENDEKAIRGRDEILTMYLRYAERANNWDLVDLSVHKILGHWLLLPTYLDFVEFRHDSAIFEHARMALAVPFLGGQDAGLHKDYKLHLLDELATSDNLWKQRMSIVCSWKTSQQGDPFWCLRYAEIHLHHPHDLMHKAVGWMLREMGKRVSMDLLRDFLRQHAHEMPRTMLRYAIEKMNEEERKQWMEVPTEKSMPSPSKISPFAGIPTPQFVDLILHDAKQGDEAVYYLLHHRLDRQLHEIYTSYHHHLLDDFEDIEDDFFLYLREGGKCLTHIPYQSLQSIKNKESFEAWLLKTFRNYLSNRTKEEDRITFADIAIDSLSDDPSPASPLTDEQKLHVVAHLIAYALQVFYPRGRFIFLRSLLTMLNKQKALPNEDVAVALGMTDISYRVTVHRMKYNLSQFRNRLLQGEQLRLDDEHQEMALHIYDDFAHLYQTLQMYYAQTIDTLKCADAIKRLRQQHYEATGIMAHEPNSDYHARTTIKAFWNKLNRLLIV